MSTPNAVLRVFEIHNFKLLRKVRLELHPTATVLVGLNDVGKSILLEAIYLYGQVQKWGFRGPLGDSSFETSGDTTTWFAAEWLVDGENWTHSISLNADAPREELCQGDRKWSWEPKQRILRMGGEEWSAKDIERYQTLFKIQPSAWKLDTEITESVYEPLSIVRQFDTPPAYLFEPSSLAKEAPLELERPFRSGYGWALWLQEIINRRNDDLTQLEETVRHLFPFFGKVRVRERRLKIEHEISELGQESRDSEASLEPGMVPSTELLNYLKQQGSSREVFVELRCETEEEDAIRVSAADVSSGLLLALAHLALVYSDEGGRLLLLEEPENGLNSKITLEMMQALLEVANKRQRQLILTTHNSWWLDLVPLDSIRILTRDAHGVEIHAANGEALERMRAELDIYPSEVMSVHGPEGLLASGDPDE